MLKRIEGLDMIDRDKLDPREVLQLIASMITIRGDC